MANTGTMGQVVSTAVTVAIASPEPTTTLLGLGVVGAMTLMDQTDGDGLIDGEDWDEFGLKDNPNVCYAKRTRKEKNKDKNTNRNGRNKSTGIDDEHNADNRGKSGNYNGGRRPAK